MKKRERKINTLAVLFCFLSSFSFSARPSLSSSSSYPRFLQAEKEEEEAMGRVNTTSVLPNTHLLLLPAQ